MQLIKNIFMVYAVGTVISALVTICITTPIALTLLVGRYLLLGY
jgi:hypothetical protein